MRISDWSSDVCSSDLGGVRPEFRVDGPDLATFETHLQLEFFGDAGQGRFKPTERAPVARSRRRALERAGEDGVEIGRAPCGESVCQYVLLPVVDVSLKTTTQE